MPYADPERPKTWKDHLFTAFIILAFVGMSAIAVQSMIDHTREQAFRHLRDECDCLGCGS